MLWKIRFFIRNYLDIFLKCICFIMFPIFVLLLIMLISCDLCPIEFLCRKSRVITRSHKIFTNTLILSCGDLVLYIFFYTCWVDNSNCYVILLCPLKNWLVLLMSYTFISQEHRHMLRTRAWRCPSIFYVNALPVHCITTWALCSIKFQGRCPSQPNISGSIVDSSFLCFLSCTMVDNKFFVRYQL